jgi:IS66 C-terminal element
MATLCSLIETAKMNDVEPYAYLRDVRGIPCQPARRTAAVELEAAAGCQELRACAIYSRLRLVPPLDL